MSDAKVSLKHIGGNVWRCPICHTETPSYEGFNQAIGNDVYRCHKCYRKFALTESNWVDCVKLGECDVNGFDPELPERMGLGVLDGRYPIIGGVPRWGWEVIADDGIPLFVPEDRCANVVMIWDE